MTLPRPRPGLVIRYGFLWSHERAARRDTAAKDRPCAVVVATRMLTDGEVQVTVAPITHEPPPDPSASIAVPGEVRRALGLDDRPQWLWLDELNRLTWPGFDLRPIPDRPGTYEYGVLPHDLYAALRAGILDRQRERRRIARQDRDDTGI